LPVLEPTILSTEVPFDASEVTGNAGASAFIRMSAINTNKDTSKIRTLHDKDISLLPKRAYYTEEQYCMFSNT